MTCPPATRQTRKPGHSDDPLATASEIESTVGFGEDTSCDTRPESKMARSGSDSSHTDSYSKIIRLPSSACILLEKKHTDPPQWLDLAFVVRCGEPWRH